MDVYIGMIFVVGFDWPPPSFMLCEGQLLPVQQWNALFSLLSNQFGGDGRNTFGLPNLIGRVPIGFGQALSGTNYNFSQVYGQEKTVLTTANTAPHSHTATFSPTYAAQTVNIPATASSLAISPSLVALQTAGAATPQNGNLLGMGGTGGAGAPIYADPTAVPVNTVKAALGGLDVGLSGTAGTPALNANVSTMSGGTVAIQQAGGATPGVSVMQPSLAMHFVIAVNGIYPTKPS